jgi:hypothetical protein
MYVPIRVTRMGEFSLGEIALDEIALGDIALPW